MSHTILNMRWMLITEVRSTESKYDTNMKYCLAGEIHRRKLKNRTLVRRSIICQKLHQNTCQNVLHIFCGFSNELEKTWTVFYDAKKKWQIRICVYHYQLLLSALAYNDDTENNPKIAFGSFCWVSQFEQTAISKRRLIPAFWKLLIGILETVDVSKTIFLPLGTYLVYAIQNKEKFQWIITNSIKST